MNTSRKKTKNDDISGRESQQKCKNFWQKELVEMKDFLAKIVNRNKRISGRMS